jgi:decaprenylphospho-beta-D-erythro-pentofuranosid-2-ulose 2-reductase
MLARKKSTKEYGSVLLIGSTSDIGIAIVANLKLQSDSTLYLAGRTQPEKGQVTNSFLNRIFTKYDFLDESDLAKFTSDLELIGDIDLAIVALGILPPENCDLEPNLVRNTALINAVAVPVILSALAKKMIQQPQGQILTISSVATIRPRIRNFSYGSTKKAADFFALGMINKYRNSGLSISVLRPGFVYTKMTNRYSPAPFSTTVTEVANIVSRGLSKEKEIIYAPRVLKLIMSILLLTPRVIFNRLG